MRIVRALIAKLANSQSTVLITGESGTGKELAARAIHELSPRRDESFVPVNCGAIPEEFLESELFGHVRGAFTGAVMRARAASNSPTAARLFLDEIGEMSAKLQVKLLRVLQERQFEPVGSDQHRAGRCAGGRGDQPRSSGCGAGRKFREDLFYRLNVLPLELPSLRERDGGYRALVDHFLAFTGVGKAKRLSTWKRPAMAVLEKYQLARQRARSGKSGRAPGGAQRGRHHPPNDLPDYVVHNSAPQHQTTAQVSLPSEGVDLDGFLEKIENGFIQQALERSRGNKTLAAELLNLNRTTFIERLRKKGMLQSSAPALPPPAAVVNNGDGRWHFS